MHAVDRLLHDARVAVADERVAHRTRQPVRVAPADPHPEQQDDHHEGDERNEAGNGREPAQGPQGTRPHVCATSGAGAGRRAHAMIAAPMSEPTFYYDFNSPYAYLAAHRVDD